MTTIFDQFRKGAEGEQPEVASHTSEARTYTITKPKTDKEISVQHSAQDIVEGGGFKKQVYISILECGCCGALTSCDPETTRYKAPAGRCQNPECRVLICQNHIEERYSCVVCSKPLCPACMRNTYKNKDLVFCKECFVEYAEKKNCADVAKCMTEK